MTSFFNSVTEACRGGNVAADAARAIQSPNGDSRRTMAKRSKNAPNFAPGGTAFHHGKMLTSEMADAAIASARHSS